MPTPFFKQLLPSPVHRPQLLWDVFMHGTIIFLMCISPVLQDYHTLSMGAGQKICVITAILSLMVSGIGLYIIPRLLPSLFDDEKWSLGKETVLGILLLLAGCAVNLTYGAADPASVMPIDFDTIVPPLTAAIAMLALVLWNTTRFFLLRQKFNREAASINALMHYKKRNNSTPEATVVFTTSGKQASLTLHVVNLLYIERRHTTVVVHYKEKGKNVKSNITEALRQAREKLGRHTAFYRCHRNWIVNLDLVSKVTGDAQGLRLCLIDTEQTIPVSINLIEEISVRLSK